mgnify:CR=1 FL=1
MLHSCQELSLSICIIYFRFWPIILIINMGKNTDDKLAKRGVRIKWFLLTDNGIMFFSYPGNLLLNCK